MQTRLFVCSLGLALFCAQGLAQDVTRPGDTIVGSSTNTPGAEVVANVIDNSAATKYLNFDRLNTGFTVTPSGTGIVRTLTLITANDAPERDPTSFLLEGSNDGTSFTQIASGNLTAPTTRFSLYSASFSNSVSYAQYRVTFPTIRATSANSMQVAEVQLSTLADITSPSDLVSITYQPGASSNANEGVASVFDNRLDRKLDVLMGNLGPTTIDVTPAVGSTVVSGLVIYGASDDTGFPGRTPMNATLLGSNDGTNFNPIFTTALAQTNANYQDQSFSFANTTGYTHYRIVLDVPFSDTDMQIGEIELLGTAGAGTPANDNCANATPITAGTITGTNFNATGSDVTPCGNGDTLDVWYRYTASATRMVEVNTCGASELDTTLAVFASCGAATPIACDDNSCGRHEIIRFAATAGETYFVRVAGVGGAAGAFSLALDESPAVHNDVSIPLAYNFNGMVHPGEAGNPDAPQGFRSISDRGLDVNGGPTAINFNPLGFERQRYTIVREANQLDIVHIGNRNTVDGSGRPFDDVAGDGDDFGVQPDWITDPAQEGPLVTNTLSSGVRMGMQTRVGVLYDVSNGGGGFFMTLDFTDGTSATVQLVAPDWFGDQDPPAPDVGVLQQTQLGVFDGTGGTDSGRSDVGLNVVEAIVSTQSLADAGVTTLGKRLRDISFGSRSNPNAGYAIFAVTVRDPACPADFDDGSGTGTPDGGITIDDLLYYLGLYTDGVTAADVDDGSGNGVPDGGVTIDDLLYFLVRFANGC